MKLFDLDYFQVKNGEIFIVRGNWHPRGKFLACPVYWPCEFGDRISLDGKKYRKEVIEVADDQKFNFPFAIKNKEIPRNVFLVPELEITKVFRPGKIIKKFKKEFTNTIWRDIFEAIKSVGVNEKDIGIFGSYLVGLYKKTDGKLAKDIDFLVYGEENCLILQKNFDLIIKKTGLKNISQNHINYESQKLGGVFIQKNNSFELTLANKWSSVQVGDGILTTIRFVKMEHETGVNPVIRNPMIGGKKIRGIVIDDFSCNFVPRFFKIFDGKKVWKILTYFWVYHQAVRVGEVVEVCGNIHLDGNLITVDKYYQGIKILKRSRN